MNKLFSLFFLLFAETAFAQTPALKHYNFTHYTEESGLLSYQIRSVVQDSEGYIWIATHEGLQRYDGIRYKNFRFPGGSKGVQQLLVDKNNRLWLYTVDGKAGIFDTKKFVFEPVTVSVKFTAASRSALVFKKIMQDEYGNIFLLIPGNELVTYNPQKKSFSAENNFIPLQPGWVIQDMMQQPGTQKYWLCISGAGLAVYDRQTNHWSYAGNNADANTLIKNLEHISYPNRIFFDRQNRLWVSERKNDMAFVHGYDIHNNKIFLNSFSLTSQNKSVFETNIFTEQKDGTLWITGLNVFSKYLIKENVFEHVYNGYTDDRSIDFVTITATIEDRENNIWIGTANNGLFRFNPSAEFFTNILHTNPYTGMQSDNAPISIAHLKDSSILAGIWNEPPIYFDKNLNRQPLPFNLPNNETANTTGCITVSADNNTVWMGSKTGFYKFSQNDKQLTYYNTSSVKSRLREMAEDKKGNIWMGSDNDGVYKYLPAAGKSFEESFYKIKAIPPVRINKIMVDKNGQVWVASFGEGVFVLDPATDKVLYHFHQKGEGIFKLPEQSGVSVLEYNDSLIIIATSSHLLFYNPQKKIISFTSGSHLITGFIASVEKDNTGHLWVSTTSGLFRVTIQNKVFIKFNRLDGIRNDYFITTSSHVMPDGRMLFGATATLVVFDPAKIKVNTSFPSLKITDIRIMNRSLRVDSLLALKQITLEPDENSLEVDLSTLSYNTGYAIKYKMEGLDKEWKTADKQQQLVYSFVPAGNYTLLLTTIDAEGHEAATPYRVIIKVLPPFYKTWWFYCLLTLIAGAILFMIDRERMQRKESLQKMRSNIAGKLHEEVNTALGNINILSEMARMKADKEPAKSKEFIEQIQGKSHDMMIAMDDMLWSIDPENDSMIKTVYRMKEYIAALNNRHGLNTEMIVDKRVEKLELNMQLRHESFILFKEIIKTMAQVRAKYCQVHLGYEKEKLFFTIQVQNDCCNIKELTSLFQRRDLEERMNAICAEFNADVHKNISVFLLKIPVR